MILIACSAQKRTEPMPARDLYIGGMFKHARALAERSGEDYLILSAKLGVVHPDTIIAPYEKSLADMPAAERKVWGQHCALELERLTGARRRKVLLRSLMGARYETPLMDAGLNIQCYLAGQPIGMRLRLMKHAGTIDDLPYR